MLLRYTTPGEATCVEFPIRDCGLRSPRLALEPIRGNDRKGAFVGGALRRLLDRLDTCQLIPLLIRITRAADVRRMPLR